MVKQGGIGAGCYASKGEDLFPVSMLQCNAKQRWIYMQSDVSGRQAELVSKGFRASNDEETMAGMQIIGARSDKSEMKCKQEQEARSTTLLCMQREADVRGESSVGG